MSIFLIITLVIGGLWVYELIEGYVQSEEYIKIGEENELLRLEIENLRKQNRTLLKVLELKQDLK